MFILVRLLIFSTTNGFPLRYLSSRPPTDPLLLLKNMLRLMTFGIIIISNGTYLKLFCPIPPNILTLIQHNILKTDNNKMEKPYWDLIINGLFTTHSIATALMP